MATFNVIWNNLNKKELFYKGLAILLIVFFFLLSKYMNKQMLLDAQSGLLRQSEQKETLSWVFLGLCYLSFILIKKRLWPVIALILVSHIIMHMLIVKF